MMLAISLDRGDGLSAGDSQFNRVKALASRTLLSRRRLLLTWCTKRALDLSGRCWSPGLTAARGIPRLPLAPGRQMAGGDFNRSSNQARLLGVVSDTHGNMRATREAVRRLESLHVDAVVHCGDIGSPEIPALFAAWPAHYVLGNVDWNAARLRLAIDAAGHLCHDRFGTLELNRRSIALIHGDDADRLREAIESQVWDLVCYGHTHVAENHYEAKTLVLNPGAVHRASIPSVAVVDLASLEVTFVRLE